MKRFILPMLLLLSFTVFATTQQVPDSLGSLAPAIIEKISKVKVLAPFAIQLYTGFATIIGLLLSLLFRTILNKIGTKWYYSEKMQDVTVNIAWRIAAKFLGKSILYYKMKADTENEKALATAKAVEHFKKHEPIFNIDLEKAKENSPANQLYDPFK